MWLGGKGKKSEGKEIRWGGKEKEYEGRK